ncbi:sterol desaturase [Sphingomonas oleivorans]|uniref:Sterol desaturase n=1 Tax=Sphingomonas oleivorans TaxID=1735121 RepID=A0A2T5FVE2_9SPHN|nr:sterol desaturase family protein [Sphingomonas oleivorans]PTQ09417.1 sterol desaturase [Sphingomonas oleivorans]
MEQLARSPIFLTVVTITVLAEIVWRLRTGRGYDHATALTSLGLAAGNIVMAALKGSILGGIYAAIWSIAPVHLPMDDWRVWAAGFLAVEFAYYGFHRASHRVRWLWASHAVHHSAEQLTVLAALRLSWANFFSLGWIFYVPLILIGFDPRMVATLLAANLHFQFFLHSEAVGRLGPIEWIFNTPAHHRAHHASNEALIDKNYGGVLIIFDRLFGTLAPETDEPIRYGLAHRPAELNPVRLVLREWRLMFTDMGRQHSIRAALKVALSPP